MSIGMLKEKKGRTEHGALHGRWLVRVGRACGRTNNLYLVTNSNSLVFWTGSPPDGPVVRGPSI